MCGPEAPITLDWGPQGSGKHMEAQAGPPQAKAATDWAKLQRVGCKWLDSWEGLGLTPDWGGARAPLMGLQRWLWGPHTFLVGGSQEGLHPAYPDLPPGLLNLNK